MLPRSKVYIVARQPQRDTSMENIILKLVGRCCWASEKQMGLLSRGRAYGFSKFPTTLTRSRNRKYHLEGKGYAPNNYLGYSIEPACSSRPFIPHSQRKRQAYVLAKKMRYFEPEFRAWQPDFYDAAHEAANIEFVSGVRGTATITLPPRLQNCGYMSLSSTTSCPNLWFSSVSGFHSRKLHPVFLGNSE